MGRKKRGSVNISPIGPDSAKKKSTIPETEMEDIMEGITSTQVTAVSESGGIASSSSTVSAASATATTAFTTVSAASAASTATATSTASAATATASYTAEMVSPGFQLPTVPTVPSSAGVPGTPFTPSTPSTPVLDKSLVEQTIHTRLNQSLSDMTMNVGQITKEILEAVLPVVLTTVVGAVNEVLDKFVSKFEKTQADQTDQRLQSHIRTLTYKNDALEQYSRRESVRIFGVTEATNESSEQTEEKVLKVFGDMGAAVTGADISACHRVGKPKHGRRAVIVRFTSRKSRQMVMTKKRNLRDKPAYDKVYINDDLTPLRQKLLGYVKDLPVTEKAWTIGGRILVQKRSPPGLPAEKIPKPVMIESPDDLFHLGVDVVDYERLGLGSVAFGEGIRR